jgi:hypothetical protein
MRAISFERNGWITKGNSADSPIVTNMASGNGEMAQAFRNIVPDSGGLTYKEVLINWIDQGCETEMGKPKIMAARAVSAVGRETAAALAVQGDVAPAKRKKLFGNGLVH